MTGRSLYYFLLVSTITLAGCGGGKGGDSSRSLAQQRAVASTRVMRATMAMAGLGARITRAPAPRMGARVARMLGALRRTRDVQQGFDDAAQLYYTLTINEDGAGRQDLYTDTARQAPAGSFVWGIPTWNGGQSGSYPATIKADFQITGGEYAGAHGTLTATPNDAVGTSGRVQVAMTDGMGETADATFTFGDGLMSGENKVRWPDGTSYTEVDETLPSGEWRCTITYDDGSTEVLLMDMDGTGSTTLYESDGDLWAWGDYDENGYETIDYGDGSSDSWDVDTGIELDWVKVKNRAAGAASIHPPAVRLPTGR